MNLYTIKKIVKASGVIEGELILVHYWGEEENKEIANHFMLAVASLGATPVFLQQSRAFNHDMFHLAKVSCFKESYFELFSKFDGVLDIFAYQPVVLGYDLPEEQMTIYRKYMSRLFGKFMECKRFTQIRIPTKDNAAESNLNPEEYIARMTNAYDVDYDRLRSNCNQAVERWKGANQISIYTEKNCILYMELSERMWNVDAGDGDIPCGEIYIAPVENKTQGSIYFDMFYLEDEKYSEVILTIIDGEICGSSNATVAKYFAEQPREDRIVCEFGIGMNPNITSLCGYTVLDEKMIGTFHIAVGDNTMFGGENHASNHMDFVGIGRIEEAEKWKKN